VSGKGENTAKTNKKSCETFIKANDKFDKSEMIVKITKNENFGTQKTKLETC